MLSLSFLFVSTLPIYGMIRYRAVMYHVEHGQYPVDATGPLVFMGTAVIGGILALVIAVGVAVTM